MSDTRKINFFEIIATDNYDCRSCINAVLDTIRHFNNERHPNRQKNASSGGIIQILEAIPSGHYDKCKAILIRNEFPEIVSKQFDTSEQLEAEDDEDKGISEETHFVISKNPNYRNPIIAIESSMKGPKFTDIQRYFEFMLHYAAIDCKLTFEPIFAFDYDEFLRRINDVAQVKMVFYHNKIEEYINYDPEIGQLLRAAMRYGDSEYITIEFSINFQKRKLRHPTSGLNKLVNDFINIFKNNPSAKEYIHKLDVRAEDGNWGNRLRLFDLIESKIASEVAAERKRRRSQYYNSHHLYESIRAQIETDFRD